MVAWSPFADLRSAETLFSKRWLKREKAVLGMVKAIFTSIVISVIGAVANSAVAVKLAFATAQLESFLGCSPTVFLREDVEQGPIRQLTLTPGLCGHHAMFLTPRRQLVPM
jgi:hypothetical protein